MTLNLSVVIDGESLPLSRCDWVLRQPCGCLTSIMHAVTSLGAITSENEAWDEFHDEHTRAPVRRKAIKAARAAGYTVDLMSIHAAVEAYLAPCTHTPGADPAQTGTFDPTDPSDHPADVTQ